MAAQPTTPSPSPSPWTPPLLLTVRFSTSLPDLLLDIPAPARTSVAALKHLIRGRLREPDSQRRLRFIHQGKILPDRAALGAVLRPLPPPPLPAGAQRNGDDGSGSGSEQSRKGKAVVGAPTEPPSRVYVNCSIGDSLTDEELQREARAALDEPLSSSAPVTSTSGLGSGAPRNGGSRQATSTTYHNNHPPRTSPTTTTTAHDPTEPLITPLPCPPPPRGFDRLLSAGFTSAEVNQLRLSFASIQTARRTADTPLLQDELRALEDAWIDDNAADAGRGGYATTSGWGGSGGDEGQQPDPDAATLTGMLDLLIPGMAVGFFWPLASFAWLMREDGLCSRAWKAFVGIGFAFSLVIGLVRAIAGVN